MAQVVRPLGPKPPLKRFFYHYLVAHFAATQVHPSIILFLLHFHLKPKVV